MLLLFHCSSDLDAILYEVGEITDRAALHIKDEGVIFDIAINETKPEISPQNPHAMQEP